MHSKKKNLLKAICKAKPGCGCGRPKLSDIHVPIHKPKISSSCCSSSCGKNEEHSSREMLLNVESLSHPRKVESDSMSSKIGDSVAVVKDSNDPYEDFRQSMLQMIVGKEIYTEDGLKRLLDCFLELNLPCYHEVIAEAFTEVWHMVISEPDSHEK